jgi:hypothetical protein
MQHYPVRLCEAPDCYEPADYELVGRWTIFDWLEVGACLVHVPAAIRFLRNRTVDGQAVVEVEQRVLSA